jgi:hypothetical protein
MKRATHILAVVSLAVVVALPVGAATADSTASVVEIDATSTTPNDVATHTVQVTVADGDAVAGQQFASVRVDYAVAQPSADVSNVGVSDIERVGIDRGDDAVGTRIDAAATVTEVSATRDGNAIRVGLGGNHTLDAGDEVVVVLDSVQNPQNAGTASVDVTVNTDGGQTTTTGSVTYERQNAAVTLPDQSSDGDTVIVDSVTLSEGGFVVVQTDGGENTDAILGSSAYLPPGTHEDVTVTLERPLDESQSLTAQVYTDSDSDRRFEYDTSGGERDGPYLSVDDNVLASDSAEITVDGTTDSDPTDTEATPTNTPADGGTPTADDPTDTESASEEDTPGDGETDATTNGDTTTESGAGFGVVLAALVGVLVVVGALTVARRDR